MLSGGFARMLHSTLRFFCAALLTVTVSCCLAQSLPATAGETLSGKHIVLADAVRGHTVILVAGFSREGGAGSNDWVKAIHADPAFANAMVYPMAMLAGAPGFIRGMIRSGMKKGLSLEQQDKFVVLTDDEKQWRTYFDVTTDNEPYVVLLDAQGRVLWRGHGSAANSEPQLRASMH
jgi:hypothetical protein